MRSSKAWTRCSAHSCFRTLAIAVVLLTVARAAWAVPAYPGLVELTQADGTTFQARLVGDEWINWAETPEGFTLVFDNASGNWAFADRDAEGNLIPTLNVAGKVDPVALGLVKGLRPSRAAIRRARAIRTLPPAPGVEVPPPPAPRPVSGTRNVIVIAIDYPDNHAIKTTSAIQDNLFSDNPGSPRSMRDYYKEVSLDNFYLQGAVAGWYRAANNRSYYGYSNGFARAQALALEAVTLADASVNFANYDNDGDGWVDGVVIVHAGRGTEESGDYSDIWSHAWSLAAPYTTNDGVKVYAYNMQPEVQGDDLHLTTIGVFCHEYGHTLGLPDLYDYGYDSAGVGDFCIMASGSWAGITEWGDSPVHFSAWPKSQLGFVTPTEILETFRYTLQNVQEAGDVLKFRKPFSANEYFLLENRQGVGFDVTVPGVNRGILVYHVDENQPDNDDQTHYLVDVEEASGAQHLEQYTSSGDDGDYFRSGYKTLFTHNTVPNSKSYGATPLALNIQNIGLTSLLMSLEVVGTTCSSLSSTDVQPNVDSLSQAISADARFVAFVSGANNIVGGDFNGVSDVFLRDRLTRQTIRVSVDSSGAEVAGASDSPAVSASARYVAFVSASAQLVIDDTNGVADVFVKDTETGEVFRVSVASDGTEGDGASASPKISADGRYVLFTSLATNLVSGGGDTNGVRDLFLHDGLTGDTTRLSVHTDGTEANGASGDGGIALSADGRYAAFASAATNLVANDLNAKTDIFVRDIGGSVTTRVSIATGGAEGDGDSSAPDISANGQFVSFQSVATNLVLGDTNIVPDIFVRDRASLATSRASISAGSIQGNNTSSAPSISADGRFVAFVSLATNFGAVDTNVLPDIYVRDRQSNTISRVSTSTSGTQALGGDCFAPSASASGLQVAFASAATNLVSGDFNLRKDVFLSDRGSPAAAPILSVAPAGTVDFGVVPLYSTTDLGAFTVTNTGSSALIGSVSTSDPFSVIDGSFFVVPPAASQTIWIRLYPASGGTFTREVSFSSNGGSATREVTAAVTSDPPVLDPVGDKTVNENELLTFTLHAVDPNGDPVTYSGENLPQGAAVDPTTGDFNWTPSYTQAGDYSVTFIASDGYMTDSETVTITVDDVPGPPAIDPIGNKTVAENVLLAFTVTASDPDGDPVSLSSSGLPPGANFNESTGLFSWTPGYDQAGSYPGVTFTASDGTLSSSEAITITVINVNRPPVLDAVGSKIIVATMSLSFTLSATDPDGETLQYSGEPLPTGASLNSTSGLFNWTPTVEQIGSYEVLFSVSDGDLSDSELVSIEVTPDNLAPVVSSLSATPNPILEGVDTTLTIQAQADESATGGTNITGIYYEAVDNTGLIVASGEMTADDGSFDSPIENGSVVVNCAGWIIERSPYQVRAAGKDGFHNMTRWSPGSGLEVRVVELGAPGAITTLAANTPRTGYSKPLPLDFVSCSSEEPSYPGSNAVDGLTATFWRSQGKASPEEEWIILEVPYEVILGRVLLRGANTKLMPVNFKVKMGDSETGPWYTVVSKWSYGPRLSQKFSLTASSAAWGKYVLCEGLGRYDEITGLYSLQYAEIYVQARVHPSSAVALSWKEPLDAHDGTVFAYDVRYSTSPITGGNWNAATPVAYPPTPRRVGGGISFVIHNLPAPNTTYYFAVKSKDRSNNWSALSNVVSYATAAPEAIADPRLLAPEDEESVLGGPAPAFSWDSDIYNLDYTVYFSPDPFFLSAAVKTYGVGASEAFTPTAPQWAEIQALGSIVYWRVRGTNASGALRYGNIWEIH